MLELSVVYGLILLVLWTPQPWQVAIWGVVAVAMLTVACGSFDGLKAMGLSTTNLLSSFWAIPVSLAFAVVAIALAGNLHTLHLPASPAFFLLHCGAYALWALFQQFGLQCLFLSRLLRLFPDAKYAVATAAVLFAIVHLPSPILTILTLIWGLAACLLFLRYHNLYSVALAHAILGITIAITIPNPMHHNMRVGLGYLTYGHSPRAALGASVHPSAQP